MPYPMTNALHEALNSLTASDRRVMRSTIGEMKGTTALTRVMRAIAVELSVLDLAEIETLQALERDRAADMDVLHAGWPLPGPDPTMRLTFDPDTGDFTPDSGPGEGVSP